MELPLSVEMKIRKMAKGSAGSIPVHEGAIPDIENPHRLATDLVVTAYETSLETGLTQDQVTSRLAFYGPNQVKPEKEKPLLIRFLLQLFSGFGLLLFIAFVITFITYIPLGEPNPAVYNLALSMCLLAVMVLQAAFNFYQEYQAGNVLKSFKKMMPLQSTVVRYGEKINIPASELTVGDVVEIGTGNKVPADLRLVEVHNLKVDNSTLTGESDPARCTAAICERGELIEARNMLFLGTSVTEGTGIGIVVSVGANCEMGRIMSVAASTNSQTPLNREIMRIVWIITFLACLTGLAVTLGWDLWLKVDHPQYLNAIGAITNVIGVLVVYIPEGLPIAVTIGLALIAKRLCNKYNVLVTKLGTVETLGCVTMLASDKTGTLTENKMTITHVIVGGIQTYEVKDSQNTSSSVGTKMILRSGVLCNAGRVVVQMGLVPSQKREEIVGGNGVDVALLKCALDCGLHPAHISSMYDTLAEIPFSSSTKYAVTVHRANALLKDEGIRQSKSPMVTLKGAPEILFQYCTTILNDDGSITKITPDIKTNYLQTLNRFGELGNRMLAIAGSELDSSEFPEEFVYNTENLNFPITNLTLLGIVAISDPPRKEVPKAISDCLAAKIRVIMVTGDHQVTALAIARQVGIVTHENIDNFSNFTAEEFQESEYEYYEDDMSILQKFQKIITNSDKVKNPKKVYYDYNIGAVQRALVITGHDLNSFTSKSWDWAFKYEQIVFARTTPDQKLAIVTEAQRRGHTVAVTGDGANDAPALKKSDVGVAMHSGTDVARDSADIVLLTNSFAGIVIGIREGRLVFSNLQKLISYLLPAGNFSELIPVIANVFFGVPLPLQTFLMIIICACTDLFGSLSLMYEAPESDIMIRGPRNRRNDKLLSMRVLVHACLFIGVIESVAAFVMWFWFWSRNGIHPSDLVFAWDFADPNGWKGRSFDELQELLNQSQSVFFVTLVVCQLGNLLTTRKKAPYSIGCFRRVKKFVHNTYKYKRFVRLYCMAFCAEVIWAIIFTMGPAIQEVFLTRTVAIEYWFTSLGFAAAVFVLDEIRKLIHLKWFPNF